MNSNKSVVVNFATDPNYVLTKNGIFYSFCKTIAIYMVLSVLSNLIVYSIYLNDPRLPVCKLRLALVSLGVCLGVFMCLLVFIPKYGAGKPSAFKIWPLVLGAIIYVWIMSKNTFFEGFETVELVLHASILAFTLHLYFLFLGPDRKQNDPTKSGWFFIFYRNSSFSFKPWIYKLKAQKSADHKE